MKTALKKLRKALGAVLTLVKSHISKSKPILKAAIGKETQALVAIFKEKGLAKIEELASGEMTGPAKGEAWKDWALAEAKGLVEATGQQYGKDFKVRRSELSLVLEILYKFWRSQKGKG
jgi:hypothetical protein